MSGRDHALVLGVAALVGLDHALFAALDDRVPPDLGLFFDDVPRLFDHWDPAVLSSVGGWYRSLLVAWFHLFGPGAGAFAAQAAVVVVVVVYTAGRLGGPLGAMLVAALPVVWIQGRIGWIHVPEAALLLGALASWRADPGLDRRRSVLLLGGLGALAALLRPSGVAWLGVLALVLLRRVGRRALPVVAAWLLAAVPAALEGRAYLAAKLAARERYTLDVPGLLHQLPFTLGTLPLLAVGLGLLGALRGPRRPDPVLIAWAAVPAGLFVLFRAGVDNFTLGGVALALVGSAGLSNLGRLGAALPAFALVLSVVVQWAPSPTTDSAAARIGGMLSLPVHTRLKNYARVHHGWGREEVAALVDALCPNRPCTIGVVQGLFRPHGEDPGRFELFLAGLDGVRLADLREKGGAEAELSGLVLWDCPDGDPAWFRRFPQAQSNAWSVIQARGMRPLGTHAPDPDCLVQGWVAEAAPAPRSDTPHQRIGPRGRSGAR